MTERARKFDPTTSALLRQAIAAEDQQRDAREAEELVPTLRERASNFVDKAFRKPTAKRTVSHTMSERKVVSCEVPIPPTGNTVVEVSRDDDMISESVLHKIDIKALSDVLVIPERGRARVESKSYRSSGTVMFGPVSIRDASVADIEQYMGLFDVLEKSWVKKSTKRSPIAPFG